ncbi:hypothetical protein D9615_000961 [Tricholomella constricta]|uniref:Uncharacterized protein n=1 Tax=Tricholomella constricta TaxID=117010 RepID=A0A8H5HKE8_9AGAR|nr:hypothetical protein D9615_000961 [Tricholomella constricta]
MILLVEFLLEPGSAQKSCESSIYLLEPGSAQKSVIETSEAFVIVKSIQVIVYICKSVKLPSSLFKLSYTSASQVKSSQVKVIQVIIYTQGPIWIPVVAQDALHESFFRASLPQTDDDNRRQILLTVALDAAPILPWQPHQEAGSIRQPLLEE